MNRSYWGGGKDPMVALLELRVLAANDAVAYRRGELRPGLLCRRAPSRHCGRELAFISENKVKAEHQNGRWAPDGVDPDQI